MYMHGNGGFIYLIFFFFQLRCLGERGPAFVTMIDPDKNDVIGQVIYRILHVACFICNQLFILKTFGCGFFGIVGPVVNLPSLASI